MRCRPETVVILDYGRELLAQARVKSKRRVSSARG